MTPEQATFLAHHYVRLMTSELPVTLKVLRAVPDATRDYRPDGKSRTAWDLARHIAQSDVWFLDSVVAGSFAFDKAAADALAQGWRTTADVATYYEGAMPARLEAVQALSPDVLRQEVDFFGVVRQQDVLFLAFANNHSIHHRGQLSAYLRAMGAKVPAIVGPSGDEGFGG